MSVYILVTGEVYQKGRNKKKLYRDAVIDMTETYGIFGPLPPCATLYFWNSKDWKAFNTPEEAREAASKL